MPLLVSERILPLPRHVREALIDIWCPEGRRDVRNRDCLMRIYLGQRHSKGTPYGGNFSLRNFKLTLEKVEQLGLEKGPMAVAIAEGLAALHWGARCNAQDVEFVIGTSRIPEDDHQVRRTVDVWLLDFNQCTPITMDEKGCMEAAKAFWGNDPYYPRPLTKVQPFHSLDKEVFEDRNNAD